MKKNQNCGYEDELEIDEMLNELENQTSDSPEFIFHVYDYELCADSEYSWQEIHDHVNYEEYEEMMKNGYIDPEELAADKKLNELENQTIESMEYEFIDYNYYEEIIRYWICDDLYDREKYL